MRADNLGAIVVAENANNSPRGKFINLCHNLAHLRLVELSVRKTETDPREGPHAHARQEILRDRRKARARIDERIDSLRGARFIDQGQGMEEGTHDPIIARLSPAPPEKIHCITVDAFSLPPVISPSRKEVMRMDHQRCKAKSQPIRLITMGGR